MALPYPEQSDCIWIGCDQDDQVAAFVTGGEGPIAAAALQCPSHEFDIIENRVLDLPCFTSALVVVSVPNPTSFIDLAERGLFVYDWTDLHRVTTASIGAYQMVARPETPIAVDALPKNLARSAKGCRFNLTFGTVSDLDPHTHLDCLNSRSSRRAARLDPSA